MKVSDLHIRVDEIPNEGKTLSGTLPAEWLAEHLLPAYTPAGPVQVTLMLTRLEDQVLVEGHFSAQLNYECSRTLAPCSTPIAAQLQELFSESVQFEGEGFEEEFTEEDLSDEPWYIQDGLLDLENFLGEFIVIAQDPYPISPAAADAPVDPEKPLWTSQKDGIDPRWEKLKNLKLD